MFTTKDRKIIVANQYLEQSLGLRRTVLEGKCLYDLLSKASQLFCDSYVIPTVLRDGRCCEVLLTLQSDHGPPIPTVVNVKQMSDGCLSWTFVEAENRTKLFKELEAARRAVEEQREELEQLSRTDALTNLANRREFDDALNRAFKNAERSKQPVALLMMDIDDFKTINDTYGHDVGDKALQALAGVLRNTIRETNTIARFGGDEFACILPNTDVSDAMELSKRLHKSISELTFECAITVSIGISVRMANVQMAYPGALKRADHALYAAKQAGRNTTAVWNSHHHRTSRRPQCPKLSAPSLSKL